MAALSHLRVLDLSRVLAGPWCSQTLADLGADVVKIERPGTGDDTRGWGPPYLRDADGNDTSEAAYYLAANRGKRSVTVDISRPQGQDIIRRLVARSDVLIENYKAGQLARYGLDALTLRAAFPRLIYCSITGFGQTGPYAQRPGYDFIVQGMGGLMSLTGEAGGEPQKVGVAVADLFTGLYACTAILAAVAERERTGAGQVIDLALLDTQVAMLANVGANHLVSGQRPARWGNAHPNIVPYQTFEAADGHVIVAVGNDAQFAKFVALGGRAALATDPRFATNRERVKNRGELVPLLAQMVKARPRRFWAEGLEAAGVPCGPINAVDEVFADPQVQARGMRVDAAHPLAGTVPLVGSPIRMDGQRAGSARHPPLLGEHTGQVLDELGYDACAIDQLRRDGVV
jgi:crotonobetainyl-CoA:carnitine CoA-transferase CaiB-like acyl-CoA transferase